MDKKFIVSTDSTCDLYAEFVKANDIAFVSLNYTIENSDGSIYEGKDNFTEYSQYTDFYAKLRSGGLSRTSMLNYESHYNHFINLAKNGARDVVHFTISSGLSPTVTVAEKAAADVKKDYPDFNLYAVDSLSATIGQGMLVREALRIRDEGGTAKQAFDSVNDLKYKIQYSVIANDLNYLKRGGRVSALSAMAGTMLGIKPVLSFNKEGKLVVTNKIRGMRKALDFTIEKMEKYPPSTTNSMIFVVHTDAEKDAEVLAGMIENKFGIKPEIVIMGPVIGSHLGPDAVAVGWKSDVLRED
ncbi:MAG: DegV family protein [Clostridia bacterium]|nr:DegV family protein [Clostridia bacterium]